MAISVDKLAEAIMDGLNEYADAVASDLKDAAEQAADDCVQELKRTSPVRKGKKGGKYARSWKAQKSFENGVMVRYTVYNKKYYRLTHLLEKGHAKRGGGRVAAIPHIEPAEQKAIEEFEKKAKEACQP